MQYYLFKPTITNDPHLNSDLVAIGTSVSHALEVGASKLESLGIVPSTGHVDIKPISTRHSGLIKKIVDREGYDLSRKTEGKIPPSMIALLLAKSRYETLYNVIDKDVKRFDESWA